MYKKSALLNIALYSAIIVSPIHTAHLQDKNSWSDTVQGLTVGTCALVSANIIGKQIIKADSSCIVTAICAALGGIYAIRKVPALLSRKNPLSSIANDQISIDHAVTNTLLIGSTGYLTKEFLNYCNIRSSNPADIACQILVGVGVGATIHWVKENVEKLEHFLKKSSSN